MLEVYFKKRVKEVFEFLEVEYGFTAEIAGKQAVYYSDEYVITIYFERKFEIYIIISNRKDEIHVHLSSLSDYLGVKEEGDFLLTRNQVSKETDIDYVLRGLKIVLDKVLNEIIGNRIILMEVLNYQEKMQAERYNKWVVEKLTGDISEEWRRKNYKCIVEKHETAREQNHSIDELLSDKTRKQVEYSKKAISTHVTKNKII